MKELLLTLSLLLAAGITLAQGLVAPVVRPPKWARGRKVLEPKGRNFIYAHGVGVGDSEEAAKDKAEGDAYVAAVKQLDGIIVESQEMQDVRKYGLSKAAIGFTKMRYKQACKTPPIYATPVKPAECKVYVLLQVQKNVNSAADFYDPDPPSYTDSELENDLARLRKWMKKNKQNF
jgi:hypothetical protein